MCVFERTIIYIKQLNKSNFLFGYFSQSGRGRRSSCIVHTTGIPVSKSITQRKVVDEFSFFKKFLDEIGLKIGHKQLLIRLRVMEL